MGKTMIKYCPECGEKIEGSPKFCSECGGALSRETTTSKSSYIKKSESNINSALGFGYLFGGLLSLFLGIFCLFNREFFVLLFMPYYESYAYDLTWAVSKYGYSISLSISILVIWSILLIVTFAVMYYKRRHGRIIGAVVCIIGIISSFYLYWGGFGLVFLALFVILLIATILLWKKLKIKN